MRRYENGAPLRELPARREGLHGCFEGEDVVSSFPFLCDAEAGREFLMLSAARSPRWRM